MGRNRGALVGVMGGSNPKGVHPVTPLAGAHWTEPRRYGRHETRLKDQVPASNDSDNYTRAPLENVELQTVSAKGIFSLHDVDRRGRLGFSSVCLDPCRSGLPPDLIIICTMISSAVEGYSRQRRFPVVFSGLGDR